MAITPLRTQWSVARPVAEVARLLIETGYSLVRQGEDGTRQLERDFGHKATSQLLEGLIPSILPIKAEITLQGVGEQETRVEVVLRDRGSWLFTYAALYKRYLVTFQEITDRLRVYLGVAGPAQADPPLERDTGADALAGSPTARERSAASRLRELQRLLDEGLITDEQHKERRARILEEL